MKKYLLTLTILIIFYVFAFGDALLENTAPRYTNNFTQDSLKITINEYPHPIGHSLGMCYITIINNNLLKNISFEVNGQIIDSHLTDLDKDGYFEIIAFSISAGSGSYGDVHFYEWDGKALNKYPLPQMTEAQKKGYMGKDKFSITENSIMREFPVYLPSDPMVNPTGGKRVIEYSLVDNRIESN